MSDLGSAPNEVDAKSARCLSLSVSLHSGQALIKEKLQLPPLDGGGSLVHLPRLPRLACGGSVCVDLGDDSGLEKPVLETWHIGVLTSDILHSARAVLRLGAPCDGGGLCRLLGYRTSIKKLRGKHGTERTEYTGTLQFAEEGLFALTENGKSTLVPAEGGELERVDFDLENGLGDMSCSIASNRPLSEAFVEVKYEVSGISCAVTYAASIGPLPGPEKKSAVGDVGARVMRVRVVAHVANVSGRDYNDARVTSVFGEERRQAREFEDPSFGAERRWQSTTVYGRGYAFGARPMALGRSENERPAREDGFALPVILPPSRASADERSARGDGSALPAVLLAEDAESAGSPKAAVDRISLVLSQRATLKNGFCNGMNAANFEVEAKKLYVYEAERCEKTARVHLRWKNAIDLGAPGTPLPAGKLWLTEDGEIYPKVNAAKIEPDETVSWDFGQADGVLAKHDVSERVFTQTEVNPSKNHSGSFGGRKYITTLTNNTKEAIRARIVIKAGSVSLKIIKSNLALLDEEPMKRTDRGDARVLSFETIIASNSDIKHELQVAYLDDVRK